MKNSSCTLKHLKTEVALGLIALLLVSSANAARTGFRIVAESALLDYYYNVPGPDSYPVCKSNIDYVHLGNPGVAGITDVFDTNMAFVEDGAYWRGDNNGYDNAKVNALISKLKAYENNGMGVFGTFVYREEWIKNDEYPEAIGGPYPEDRRILSQTDIDNIKIGIANSSLQSKNMLKLFQLLRGGQPWLDMSDSIKDHLKQFDGVGIEVHTVDENSASGRTALSAMADLAKWTQDQGMECLVFMGGAGASYLDFDQHRKTFEYLFGQMNAIGVDPKSDHIIYFRQGAHNHPSVFDDHLPESDSTKLTYQVKWMIENVEKTLPKNALVAHWPLDEGSGTVANDYSGNGYDGTLLNGATWGGDGIRKSYVSFDGINDRISTTLKYSISSSDDFSWSWWANKKSAPGLDSSSIMVGNRYPERSSNKYGFLKFTPVESQFANTSTVADIEKYNYIDVPQNQWHHYTMVKTGTSYQWYVDGMAEGSPVTIDYNESGSIPFLIGGDDNGSGTKVNEHFQGFIDDVRVYSYALSQPEIDELAAIPVPSPDIVPNYMVDIADLAALSEYWMDDDCYSTNLCDGRDLNADQMVNQNDLLVLSQLWLSTVGQPTIGMNFGDVTNLGPDEEAGAPGFGQTHWNSETGNTGSLVNLVDGLGHETTVSISWSASNDTNIYDIADEPGNNRMMKGYLDTGDTTTSQVTITGIPYDQYALVIYMDGRNGGVRRNGQYTVVNPADESVLAGPYYSRDNSNTDFSGSFTQTPLSLIDNESTPAGNYMVIRGLTAPTVRLDVTGGSTADTHPRGPLNAIQIVDVGVWMSQDIGAVGAPGSVEDDGSTITIEGSGSDIWLTADEFHYYSTPFSGDGEIITRVVSQTNTHTWAKAGVMIRETLDPESKHASMVVTPGEGSSFQRRPVTGDISYSTTPGNGLTAPAWVKMVRSGNTFTGYSSTDGSNWTQIGTDTVTMATDVYVGLCVTSHNEGAISTAVFTDTTISE